MELELLDRVLVLIIDHRGKTATKLGGRWKKVGIPVISANNVRGGQFVDMASVKHIDEHLFRKWMPTQLENGDVLLVSEGATFGEVLYLRSKMEVALGQRLFALRCSDKYLGRFLYYYLKSRIGQNELYSKTTGTSVLGIRQSELRKIRVPYTDKKEQTMIAEFLGSMDDGISLNLAMNETLEAVGKAIFKRWFVDFEFPNDAGAPYRSSGGAMIYNKDLRKDVPKTWKIGSILDCAEILSGGTPKTEVAEYWGGGIPWVSAKDVTNFQGSFILETDRTITQLGIENSNAKMLPKNTTVVTARGVVGSYCILSAEMAINQTNYGFKAKPECGDFFVFFSISNLVNQMKQRSYGTIFDTITTKTFHDMKIPIPPNSLIKSFEQDEAGIMGKILVNLQESRSLANIRDTLLPKLMSGKIRIPAEVK